jgi:hypothetical protein
MSDFDEAIRMSGSKNPLPHLGDDEGPVTAGRATGHPLPQPSDEDLRRAEAAWNDPAFYEFVNDEPIAAAGWAPKPTADPTGPLVPSGEEVGQPPAAEPVSKNGAGRQVDEKKETAGG